jgi:UDP-2-acetamido-3-amino-2,3-dideoxy-glucuronate N-acetyltransferase
MAPPNVAVVGCGNWGKNLVRNFAQLGALRMVCDADPARLAALKEQYPDVIGTRSLEEALGDTQVRAVVLATPAATHADVARRALAAGKDIFVEKPLALTVEDARGVMEQARRGDRILMVGHLLRYHPGVIRLKALVDAGDLGKIQYIYSNRLNLGTFRIEENILWSFAPHDISAILYLLGEKPVDVKAQGGSYLHPDRADVTVTALRFPSGVTGHIFVSWLHPYKEQKLVVVGDHGMAVFDDVAKERKLTLYRHEVEWKGRVPVPHREDAENVPFEAEEPLRAECQHFLDCVRTRQRPRTDGDEGLAVLEVLRACQAALDAPAGRGAANAECGMQNAECDESAAARQHATGSGRPQSAIRNPQPVPSPYFVHETAVVDLPCEIGEGTKVWHFSHIMKGAKIGARCILGQNVNVDGGVVVGDNVKVQNNVSLYTGLVVEDDVFLGPSCVLTNVSNPRSQVNRHRLYERTTLRRGCTIGANATIVCGVTVGRYAFVGAGAVVTRDVPDYALILGNPGRRRGWMSRHGHRLPEPEADGIMRCPESRYRYQEVSPGMLRCLDLDEEAPLPDALGVGHRSYREFKTNPSASGGA